MASPSRRSPTPMASRPSSRCFTRQHRRDLTGTDCRLCPLKREQTPSRRGAMAPSTEPDSQVDRDGRGDRLRGRDLARQTWLWIVEVHLRTGSPRRDIAPRCPFRRPDRISHLERTRGGGATTPLDRSREPYRRLRRPSRCSRRTPAGVMPLRPTSLHLSRYPLELDWPHRCGQSPTSHERSGGRSGQLPRDQATRQRSRSSGTDSQIQYPQHVS